MTSSVNWGAAYIYLFAALNSENKALYVGGSTFCRMVQHINPGSPSYQQLLPLRQSQSKSSSRKAFYWDFKQVLSDPLRFSFYRLLVDDIESYDEVQADAIRDIVFGSGHAVPTTIVPVDLWNSEKLSDSLADIDRAINAHTTTGQRH